MNINTIVYDETKIDLFQTPELLSKTMQSLLDEFCELYDNSHELCETLLFECIKQGYTFEYGLDCIPYNLNKIV
jgi:hypothetical protein